MYNMLYTTRLSNTKDFNGNYLGFRHILTRIPIPRSKNTEFFVNKTTQPLDSNQYITIKTSKSFYPTQ